MKTIFLAGIATKLGNEVVTVAQIADHFNIKVEEVTRKSGITTLRRFDHGQTLVATMAHTVHRLLNSVGVDVSKITGIFGSSSFTSATLMPSFTAHAAYEVGLRDVICDHVGLGCGGGLQAFKSAFNQLVVDASEGRVGRYIVVTGDDIRRILDPRDLNTNIFFSDGCAAVLLTNDPALATGYEVEYARTMAVANGNYGMLEIRSPFSGSLSNPAAGYMTMDGPAILRFIEDVGFRFRALAAPRASQLDAGYFIPHQANFGGLSSSLISTMGLKRELVYTDGIRTVGNLLNSSTFFGLEDALKRCLFNRNLPVHLGAFGAEQQVGLVRLIPIRPQRIICTIE